MVVVSIVALVGLVTYRTASTSIQATRRSSGELDLYMRARHVLAEAEKDLRSALPPGDDGQPSLVGTRDSEGKPFQTLELYAYRPWRAFGSEMLGTQRIIYKTDSEGESLGRKLLVTRENRLGEQEVGESVEEVVLEGVTAFDLAYLSGGESHESWVGAQGLPERVEIHLTLQTAYGGTLLLETGVDLPARASDGGQRSSEQ